MENVNKQRRKFVSLFELRYGPMEFNFLEGSPTLDKVSG